ncbi:MAG: pyridoxamine 5'-phosphate oxidase family protein [Blastocatellia bacterium]|nr:pyridoxamine 5'-phosphate oxidase family protein [Blastocatellia bacterium]
MAKNFGEIAFTESVKAEQEEYGSRRQYARMEAVQETGSLTFVEADFIAERDTFYMATVGETGFPYVQFRGGPKGFLHVLDEKTLAFADFRGNRQYISVGNLKQNNRAALILMDYVQRQRLKIYARMEIKKAEDAPELVAQLHNPAYQAKVERVIILHLEAFDWNCPQHIVQRFTLDEVADMIQPFKEQVAKLEAEIQRLKDLRIEK